MSHEHRELRFGSVELCSNGDIVAGPLSLLNSVALNSTVVDGVQLDKPDGDGQPITLTFPDGKTRTFSYNGTAWCTADGVPPSAIRQTRPEPMTQEFRISPPPSKNPATWVAVITIGAVSLVAAIYLLEPLKHILPNNKTNTNNSTPSSRKPTDPDLLSEIRLKHLDAKAKFQKTQESLTNFQLAFEQAVGYTIERIATQQSNRPREIDIAIIESPAFKRAWSQALSANVSSEHLRTRADLLVQVDKRIHDKLATLEDKQTLENLAAWANQARQRLDQQLPNLDLIRTTLKKYRHDPRIRDEQRSPP